LRSRAPLAFGALSAWARKGGARLFLVALLFTAGPLVFLMLLSGLRRPVLRLEPDGLRLNPHPFSDVLAAWEDIADVRLERRVRGRRLAIRLVLELCDEAAMRRCYPREPRWATAWRRRRGGPPIIPLEAEGLDRPPAAIARAVASRIGPL